MTKSLKDKLNNLPKERRERVLARAEELIFEEMTLRDLRVALEKTQIELGEELHMKQDGISRLERRSDILLSTLRKYICAMGGELDLVARFPKRPPILIRGIAELDERENSLNFRQR